jgi:hypothetical protein
MGILGDSMGKNLLMILQKFDAQAVVGGCGAIRLD